MDAVEHARGISEAMRTSYIASATLAVGDGVILATPTRPQPAHHTMWCDVNVDIAAKFAVVLHPDLEEQ